MCVFYLFSISGVINKLKLGNAGLGSDIFDAKKSQFSIGIEFPSLPETRNKTPFHEETSTDAMTAQTTADDKQNQIGDEAPVKIGIPSLAFNFMRNFT